MLSINAGEEVAGRDNKVPTVGILTNHPRVLRSQLLLGQNVCHHRSVLLADVDPGDLAELIVNEPTSKFADGFQERFATSSDNQSGSKKVVEFLRKLEDLPEVPWSDYVLAATLSLETRVLAQMDYLDEITCFGTKVRTDGTTVLMWETFHTALSSDALSVALLGVAELVDAAPAGAQPFDRELERLLARAQQRKITPVIASVKAVAARNTVRFSVDSDGLILGEGACQREPIREDFELDTGTIEGVSLNAGQAIFDRLVSDPAEAAIPSLVFAGDRATSSAAQQAGAMLERAGFCVGASLKREVLVDGLHRDPPRGRISRAPAMLLGDPKVEAMVTALSLRRVVNYGLGFSRCDAVALQLEPGEDETITASGIDVLARACQGAFTIDVGNPAGRAVIDRIGASRVILVSQAPDDPAVTGHLAAGGLVAARHWDTKGPWIRLFGKNGVFASAPLESRAHTRERLIYAGMHAFALVQATGLALKYQN